MNHKNQSTYKHSDHSHCEPLVADHQETIPGCINRHRACSHSLPDDPENFGSCVRLTFLECVKLSNHGDLSNVLKSQKINRARREHKCSNQLFNVGFLDITKVIEDTEVLPMAKETKPKTPRRKGEVDEQLIREMIERKAYEIYEQRGKEPGNELDDWLEAERIVKSKKR